MRRTSIMFDVEDDVYSSLVEPHKKNKTFSKLIVSLLNGYLTDGYIRAFVDDNLEEVRKAVVGSFEDSVGEMENVLASMGLYTDELGAHASAGYSKFQQKRNDQAKELDKNHVKGRSVSQNDDEVAELREKVSGLEQTVTEGFNRILEMLSNGIIPQQTEKVGVVTEEPVKTPVSDVAKNYISKQVSSIAPVSHNVVEEFDDSEEDSGSGSDMAANFLSSISSDFGSF